MKQVALVCVVLALVIAPCSLHDVEPSFQHQSCSASSSVKFVLTNRRNQTGHWTTEVKLKHDDDDDGPYEVDVEQKTSECDNSVDITAVVTASSKRPSVECARPTGYEMFEGVGYYKFHATPVIWNEARKTCEKEGAHLAIINSELESIVMKKLFGRHPNIEGVGDRYSASIGFHDHFAEGEYVTISGPPRNGLPVTLPPPGYEFFPGAGYYKFHSTSVTWDEGRRICENEGAHLAILNSASESNALKTVIQRINPIPGTVAVGFHDRFVEGEYMTIFGSSLKSAGFFEWSTYGAHQPDNSGGNENCGSIHSNGLLNDINCASKIPFMCEFTPKGALCANHLQSNFIAAPDFS